MFGFFGNKRKKVKVISRFALTRQGAFIDLIKQLSSSKKPVYILYFFDESRDFLKKHLSAEYISFKEVNSEPSTIDSDIYFINANTFNPGLFKLNTKMLYCLDHYPLYSVFFNLILNIGKFELPPELIVYGGMDEPILNAFGGERIRDLMYKMGLKESEIIEHNMISGAIEDAQKKIEAKVTMDSKANSSSEWFKLNYNQTN